MLFRSCDLMSIHQNQIWFLENSLYQEVTVNTSVSQLMWLFSALENSLCLMGESDSFLFSQSQSQKGIYIAPLTKLYSSAEHVKSYFKIKCSYIIIRVHIELGAVNNQLRHTPP